METQKRMKYIKTLSSICWHCGAKPKQYEKFKKCSGCLKVRYCSEECQKNDWCAHKKICNNRELLNCSICDHKNRKLISIIVNNIQQYVCKSCVNDDSNENFFCFHD